MFLDGESGPAAVVAGLAAACDRAERVLAFGAQAGRPWCSVHWCRDVAFTEDKSQVSTHNAPAVLAALRDLIRSTLKLVGYINTVAGRRAHTERPRVLTLYGIT